MQIAYMTAYKVNVDKESIILYIMSMRLVHAMGLDVVSNASRGRVPDTLLS